MYESLTEEDIFACNITITRNKKEKLKKCHQNNGHYIFRCEPAKKIFFYLNRKIYILPGTK